MSDQNRLADQICETGVRLCEQGFIAATEANLSCRLNETQVLCTPTMMSKADLSPRDLCIVDFSGSRVSGLNQPTSEIKLHLEIYKNNARTQAVVHCHPPHATAFAVNCLPLPSGLLAEAEYYLGEIPTIDYRTPGTADFAALIAPHATQSRCAVLRNHGAVSWDVSLERARWWMEVLEAYCRVLILSRNLGAYSPLRPEDVRELRESGRNI